MTDRLDIEREMDAYMEDDLPPLPDDLDSAVLVPPANEAAAQATMRRVKRHAREAATIADVAKVEIDRLTAWRDERVNSLQRAMDWDNRSLEAYMRGQAVLPGGRRTVKLADGELRLRPDKARVVVNDLPALLAWAFALPDPVPTDDDPNPLPNSLDALEDQNRNREVMEWVAEQVDAGVQARIAELLDDGARGLLRIKVEPAKDVLAKLDHPDYDDGVAPLSLPGGTLVPGVQLHKDPTDNFTAAPSKED